MTGKQKGYGVLIVLCLAGCGSPQFDRGNRHLLETLQTAVSAKNTEWLDAVNKQIEQQQSAGKMSAAELKTLRAVIQLAKEGQWAAAQQRLFAVVEAQRPTAEDIRHARERQRAPATKKP